MDIVLDHNHPLFEYEKLGKIVIPEDFPVNYKNIPPDIEDNNYFAIGTVLVRLCYSQQKVEKENLIWAVPMDDSFSTFPLLNEVVHVVKIFDKFYYTNKVNTKNSCNTSADFRYEQTYGKKASNRSYSGVELKGPISKFDSLTNEAPYPGLGGYLETTFGSTIK